LIDASEGITDQDISVAGYAYDRGCGCIFLLNKWDLVEKDHRTVKAFTERLRHGGQIPGICAGHDHFRAHGPAPAAYFPDW
jgi:predicted GTPase